MTSESRAAKFAMLDAACLVVLIILIAGACGETGGASAGATEGCRDLEPGAVASLQRLLPSGHRFADAMAHDYTDRVRGFDQAPITVVGGWVVDDAGAERYGAPGLWIVEGGTARADERSAKGYYTLNDVAVQAYADKMGTLDKNDRRTWRAEFPDARQLRVPFSETDSVVMVLVACLESGAV
jgi:hypothetical protein